MKSEHTEFFISTKESIICVKVTYNIRVEHRIFIFVEKVNEKEEPKMKS